MKKLFIIILTLTVASAWSYAQCPLTGGGGGMGRGMKRPGMGKSYPTLQMVYAADHNGVGAYGFIKYKCKDDLKKKVELMTSELKSKYTDANEKYMSDKESSDKPKKPILKVLKTKVKDKSGDKKTNFLAIIEKFNAKKAKSNSKALGTNENSTSETPLAWLFASAK